MLKNCPTIVFIIIIPWILLIIATAIIPDTELLFGFDILAKTYDVKLPESFNGPLLANRWLSLADHLYVDEIRGPESFATWNGNVYASIADGRIIQLLSNHYRTVTYLNPENLSQKECRKNYQSASGYCSRPLGIRFSTKGQLYAVDPYHGIFEINIENGHYQLVMNISEHRLSDGTIPKFLDDLVLIEKNDTIIIYMTDASQKWLLHDVYFTVGEMDQTGRLLSFNLKTKQLQIELDNLAFPNGLILTDNGTTILINEFNKRRILRYRLDDKPGHYDILIDGLPGEPDNIKRSLNKNHETYWIGLFTGRNQYKPSFYLDIMAKHPYLKRTYFRLIRLLGFSIETIANLLSLFFNDNDYLKQFGHNIRVANFMYPFVAEYGMAVEIDSNGRLIGSLHSPDGYTNQLSEIYEYHNNGKERYYYIGSYSNQYLGRIIVPINNEDGDNGDNNKKHSTTFQNELRKFSLIDDNNNKIENDKFCTIEDENC
ncbi:hypothetical protein DERP_011431 [Dermatophagoides pteronyssinus]|uniref:Strictosidine synthase conserved region domain-containing protein n=1 Tax=Dermatophagoides pteronyssinus TaxID=6956 RepID=A0ABQ8J5S8_DERPT|nr:hypothetical protein DERP_011431 [Dermatophagoides pteronyssinus]